MRKYATHYANPTHHIRGMWWVFRPLCTLDIINEMMKSEDDVDVVGATSIVQPNVIDGNIVEV